jgi:DNA-binding HxlR family transcriptional regulator
MDNESVAWMALCEIYRLLGSESGYKIVRLLLSNKSMGSEELLRQSGVKPATYYQTMKGLTLSMVVERNVKYDRTVIYSISPFGRNVLELSEQMMDKIKKEFHGKPSLLLSRKVQKQIS